MNRRSRIVLVILCIAALSVVAPAAIAATPQVAGLDQSFGRQGMAVSAKIPLLGYSQSIATGAGGKIVTSTSRESVHGKRSHTDIYFAEFNADGSPVKRFGNNGVAKYTVQGRSWDYQTAVDPQGRIVILMIVMPKTDEGDQDLRLFRLTRDGRRDASFNHGQSIVLFRRVPDFFSQLMKVGKHGEVYVFGGNGNVTPTMFKFNTRGKPARSYGRKGRVKLPTGNDFLSEDEMVFASLDADGSAFLVGSASNGTATGPDGTNYGATEPLINKLTPRGKLDPSFGKNGTLKLDRPEPFAHFRDLGITATGELTAMMVTSGLPAKQDAKVESAYYAERLSATGAPAPFRPVPGAPSEVSLPNPTLSPNYFLPVQSRFGTDGSYERVFSDVEKLKYEVFAMSADGTRTVQQPVVTLPESLDSFGEPVIDPRDGSILIGGGHGHRLAVIRLKPPTI